MKCNRIVKIRELPLLSSIRSFGRSIRNRLKIQYLCNQFCFQTPTQSLIHTVICLSIFIKYENAKDQDRFLRKYESRIILFAGAERMLQRKGIDTRHMKLEHLRKQYRDLISQKEKLAIQQKSTSADFKELEQIKQNMEEYLQVHPLDQEKPFNPNTTPEL